eukprot:scaffold86558_cov51-Prasinocladus_malaysianus.AAC.1
MSNTGTDYGRSVTGVDAGGVSGSLPQYGSAWRLYRPSIARPYCSTWLGDNMDIHPYNKSFVSNMCGLMSITGPNEILF